MSLAQADWQIAYQRLADAIDAAPEAIALFDAEDRYVIWNSQYAEMYGAIVETIAVGARFEDVVRAALAKGLIVEAVGREDEWLAIRLAEHRSASHNYEHHMRNGKWVRVEERRTADGGRVSFRTDITELKQREASFRLLFESNPIPMFVCHGQTLAFLAVNEAAAQHYGYTWQQLSAMSVYDLRRPGDREDLRRRTLTGDIGRQSGKIRRHVKADGSQIDVAVYTIAMTHNSQPAVIVAAIDVTARKQAEAERQHAEVKLREQKLQLDAAVGNMVQGLIMFDADERVVLVNQRYIDMYRLSSDIVKAGCSFHELMEHRKELGVFSDDPNAFGPQLFAELAAGKPVSRLVEFPNGICVQVSHRRLPGGGRVATHEDFTERQRAHSQIEFLAHYDALTKLPNRTSFNGFLAEALENATRHKGMLGLLSVDLDRLNSPVMKSEFTQFACGATMITSIAVSPCISAMMAMARSTSD